MRSCSSAIASSSSLACAARRRTRHRARTLVCRTRFAKRRPLQRNATRAVESPLTRPADAHAPSRDLQGLRHSRHRRADVDARDRARRSDARWVRSPASAAARRSRSAATAGCPDPSLSAALAEGIRAAGTNVIDVGMVATPMTYFAAHASRHRLQHDGDRQPQPARVQRAQDGDRRRDAVGRRHPGAAHAHRAGRFRERRGQPTRRRTSPTRTSIASCPT